MQFADLHTHTSRCNHASGTPEEYLQSAIAAGLVTYGISDHLPTPSQFDPLFRMKAEEFSLYRQDVRRMQELGSAAGLEVLYGGEMDYVHGRMDEVAAFLKDEPFDYLIGSIHYIGDLGYDDPDNMDRIRSFGAKRLWEEYLILADEMLRGGYPIRIMGHCDLPKLFNMHHPDRKFVLHKMQELFELCVEHEIFMEINTAGLWKPVGEMYPALDLLQLACRTGVRLTFGSDAHKPENIARGFDKALEAARAAGYRSCWTIRRGGSVRELPFD